MANQSFRETSEEIHKIFIIDIHRNHYYHDYNTLMKGEEESSEAKLVSIDHEFCFNQKVNILCLFYVFDIVVDNFQFFLFLHM